MKKIKQGVSMLLVLAVVLTMALPVMAAGAEKEYSITVTNNSEKSGTTIKGNIYTAYKLFDVTYPETSDGRNPEERAHSYTIASAFQNFTYKDNADVKYAGAKLIEYVSRQESNGAELNRIAAQALAYAVNGDNEVLARVQETAQSEEVILDVSEFGPGYYLVAGTATASDNQTITATCALDTTNPKASVQVKVEAPKIDTLIVNADSARPEATDGKGTAVNVGDTVEWKLASKVPNMAGYTTYHFAVHDALSAGLTFNEDVQVKINGTILEPENYQVRQDLEGETFAVTMDLKKLEQSGKAAVGDPIEITYAATLNTNALKTDKETNTVHLEYSNNPYDAQSKGKTPDRTVYVYDFDMVIHKVVEKENIPLAGAEFVLYKMDAGEAGNTKKYYRWDDQNKKVIWNDQMETTAKLTTDDKGLASLQGLDAGTYFLEETKAPDGYNKLAAPIQVNINVAYGEDGKAKKVTYTVGETPNTATVTENSQISLTVTVENNTGTELPSTGGMGTTIFYVVGGTMMLAAVVLLITKKKMAAKQK